ncbi:nitronate monooxygenase [Variovorax sp. PCZ-1]|uniref:NAD(P)H-dependent flavin oxidoreductase n=1 Tax=Variovorax sp. PCZ-1 TaxID=2835533 RepID=UPI001BD105BD|nr:nitronate monooxygenase [Variovorax sp. PCZ-1]MBS7807760.1 nitronate monooxygenase [Variovorax sp. PCZ-1]
MSSSSLEFCALLGITHPLIQAPMAGVQGSALAIAVSQAGGLGSLPCAMLSPEQIKTEIEAIRAATAKPYNLNFFCHAPPPLTVATPEREAAWRKLLAPYYAEHSIDPASIPAGAGRAPFSADLCDVIAPYKPPVVSFHFGLPAPELVARIKAWGGKVLSSATTVAEAKWLEAHGADAIIAQGVEAGGHRGMFLCGNEHGVHEGLSNTFPKDWRDELSTQQGTFTLLPQIVASVKVPVIAAGGIASAQGVQAAFKLGASAVQIGTAFMLCDEATTSQLHRAALTHCAAHPEQHHTQLTTLFTGRPARGITNRIMRELGSINTTAPAFPTSTAAMAPLRAAAEKTGKADFSPLWSGQNASGCRAVPAAVLLQDLLPSA